MNLLNVSFVSLSKLLVFFNDLKAVLKILLKIYHVVIKLEILMVYLLYKEIFFLLIKACDLFCAKLIYSYLIKILKINLVYLYTKIFKFFLI